VKESQTGHDLGAAPRSKVWSDAPREQSDIAGRSEFARAVATRIELCEDGHDSTVFGLVAPWGAGKTTLLQDVVARLPNWEIVWFSPWSAADVGSLTSEFVAALSEAFPKTSDVRARLASYARFGAPALKLIPLVGDVAAAVAEQTISQLEKKPAWHAEYGRLSEAIRMEHRRVLIVVDDVDRLDAEELRALLRTVRLLGRFSNVHYLMAYDQATIDGVLHEAGMNGEPSEFMEKIVQYPFEVPPVSMVVRRRWSRSIVDEVSSIPPSRNAPMEEAQEELVRTLAAGLTTPRAAERLREQLVSLSEMVAVAEVDVLDFTVLTWLRIAHHRVWEDIRLRPDAYLSWREADTPDARDARTRQIANLVDRGHPEPVIGAVNYLFEPATLQEAFDGRRWRMHHERYFDRYFQVGVDDDDVSEIRVEDALDQLADGILLSPGIEYFQSIVLGSDDERSALALDIAQKYRRTRTETSDALLEFAKAASSELESRNDVHPSRPAGAFRWMSVEIFLALNSGLLPQESMVARFGYSELIHSAYVINRAREQGEETIKNLYSGIVDSWIVGQKDQTLEGILNKPELVEITSFCIWVGMHKDFLAPHVSSASDLLDVATKFVRYTEWVGSGTEYDVVFREDEFMFAAGAAVTKERLSELPEIVDVASYELADRSQPDLTPDEIRDFAGRRLREIQIESRQTGSAGGTDV